MTVIESDYVGHQAAMMQYLDQVMEESDLTGEALASVLECPVDELYGLLAGTQELTAEHVATLEGACYEASRRFIVGCQMMRVITHPLKTYTGRGSGR